MRPEIKNLYPMKLASRIYPWGQCFNLKSKISNLKSIDRKHPGYKPPDSFRKQAEDPEIKNLYPMKLASRIYPWGQCFNLKSQISNLKSIDRKHPGYKPPDSFRKQAEDPEIKNLYPMKLASRIYPWGQCFNLKSKISNLKSIDRKHPGYKPPDSFRKQAEDPEIKNLYPMKLASRIYPWGQCFNLKSQISNLKSIDRKHPGYKPPDSFRKQAEDPEIKNLYPMKLASRIYPWGQCFNLKSQISNLKSIDRKHPGYKPPDSFRKQAEDPEIKNLYPMKLASRIYPWGQCFNLKSQISNLKSIDRKHPGYKPPDSFRKQAEDPEIKNLYPMKLASRIYPWGQCFNLKSQISNLKSIDRKHPGYKPPDSFRKQAEDPEIKNLYPMKLASRIYPWGQCFNLKSKISNLKSIDRKHPGYKPPDSFRKQAEDPEIKNLYPMKLA